MKFLLPVVLLFTFSFSSFAKNNSIQNLNLSSGVNFNFVDGQKVKTRVFGYQFNVDYKYKFHSDLSFFFNGSAVLQTGSNEVISVVDEFAPQEEINLNEGGLVYKPADFFMVKAGALNQGDLKSPLFIGNNAFAALSEKIILGPFYFSALQGIPSNNRLTKRLGQVDKGTPFVEIETIGLDIGKRDSLKIEVSRFLFKDLSNNIAFNSKILGNSTTGSTELNSEYLYAFQGYNVHLASQLDFRSFGFRLSGQYLYNDKAPSDRNLGTLARFGVYIGIFELYGESFRNESDSSPAYYNSKYYGHNNMQGTGGGLLVKAKDYNFNIRAASLTPIEETNLQTKMEIVTLNLTHKLPSF